MSSPELQRFAREFVDREMIDNLDMPANEDGDIQYSDDRQYSVREYSRAYGKISKKELNKFIDYYLDNEVTSKYKNKNYNIEELEEAPKEKIAAIKKEIEKNSVDRHPGTAAGTFFGPVVGTFAVAAITMLLLQGFGITALSAFSFLPFLAALGPVAGVLVVAALMAAAVVIGYALITGTVAAATKQSVEIFDDEESETTATVDQNSITPKDEKANVVQPQEQEQHTPSPLNIFSPVPAAQAKVEQLASDENQGFKPQSQAATNN